MVDVPAAPQPLGDPPDRVARLSYISGEVSMRPAGDSDWVAAELNRPLTTGDTLWTGDAGRVELHLGSAALRIAAGTTLSLTELSSNVVQVKLTGGTLAVRIRELDPDEEYEVDTPDAAIRLLRTGDYRIDVATNAPGTTILARSGDADVTGPNGLNFVVHSRQQAQVPGWDQQRYTITEPRPPDAFDAFCAERDQREERALAEKRLPPRMVGYDDLYGYGDWSTYPEYGPVWFPRAVPVDWAPYRYGHWVWIEPWGWTWVDDMPWGFAPFHYGRWVFVSTRWCWAPGPFHRRPIYAPALVVFIGAGGPGFQIHFRVGTGPGVAWFPLGPREAWFPPYRASRTYVTNINITHTDIRDPGNLHRIDPVRQHYMNRQIDGAVTAVPEDVFRRARPVQRELVRVTPGEAGRAPIGGSAPPSAPLRDSLGPRPSGGRAQPPAATARERQPVIVNRRPPAAPVPFEQRKPVLESTPGRVPPPVVHQAPQQQQPVARPPARVNKQEQQWDRQTTRQETQRQTRIEHDRQQQQRQQPQPQHQAQPAPKQHGQQPQQRPPGKKE